ncbi:hypothetical protein [Rheinheimera sp.]|uniref:hypothetical protein n=1 Tax=Rheinheimera sp. TaxID=1869214 RepID=UPI00404798D4
MQAANSKSIVSFQINIPVLITMVAALWFAYSAHQENLKNTKKINELLGKYEQTLDQAISSDPATLKTYSKNLRNVVDKLSKEEKELLLALLAIDGDSSAAK